MKHLKKLKGEEAEWYGYTSENVVGVNIQLLWEDSPEELKEDNFILNFCLTYTHELIHSLIWDETDDEHQYYEEQVIRTMLGEPWEEEDKLKYR